MKLNLLVNQTSFITIFALAFCVLANPAWSVPCRVDTRAINTLKAPRLGTPFEWDAHHAARDGMTQFAASIPLEGGSVLTLGTDTAKDGGRSILLAELDRRGRAIVENSYKAKDNEHLAGMVVAAKKAVVLSTFMAGKKHDRSDVRIAWYGLNGKFVKEVLLTSDVYDYETATLAADGDGLIVAFNAKHKKNNNRQALLAHYDNAGTKIWQRGYTTGRFDEVSINPDGTILAAGRTPTGGNDAAWIMLLTSKGGIVWQKTFPRGLESGFSFSSAAPDGFVAAGYTKPSDGKAQALLLIAMDAQGNPRWERYIRADGFALSPAGLLAEEDGRVVVVASATADDMGNRNHIRIIVFSPRGEIMQDEAYIDGLGARASAMTRGWGDQQIVTATVDSDEKPADPNANAFKGSAGAGATIVQKGWVFVSPGLPAWTDSCKKP
jgi:hypothetical protein